jgi:hypothetical protein
MGRISYLLAVCRRPKRGGAAALRPDAEAIRIATTAIASAGFVLTTGLIAMASAATLQIGPFKTPAAHKPDLLPRLVEEAGSVSAPDFAAAATTPGYALMLIAEDPGADAWRRMLAGGPEGMAAIPIRVAPIGAVSPLMSVPAIASRVMPAPTAWMKLSALEGSWSWDAIVTGADAMQASLFSKLSTAPTTEAGAVPPSPPAAETPTSAPVKETSAPPAATTTPAVDPKPTQSAASTVPQTPTPPLASAPPIIVAPPTQVTPPPIVTPPAEPPAPPTDAGSGDTPPSPVLPVPEPAAWTCFIIGFGLIGFGYRRRQRSPAGRPI